MNATPATNAPAPDEPLRRIADQLDFSFNPRALVTHLLVDALLLALAALSLLAGGIWLLPAIPLVAILMFRNFALMHEAVHHTAHPRDTANALLGLLSGTLCITPFTTWRDAHLAHHRWTGNLERDPTFGIVKAFPAMSARRRRVLEIGWRWRIPVLAAMQHAMFWKAAVTNLRRDRRDRRDRLTLACILAALVSWSIALLMLPAASIAALMLGVAAYLMTFEHMIVPQHVGLCRAGEPDFRVPATQQGQLTRSWSHARAIERWVVLNMNYHAEHHMFPALPWHQLQRAGALIEAQELRPGRREIDARWIRQSRGVALASVLDDEAA